MSGLSPLGLDPVGLPPNTGGNTNVTCTLGIVSLSGLQAIVGGAVDINCTLGSVSLGGLSGHIGSISITTPTAYQPWQQDSNGLVDMVITGNWSRSPAPSAIMASWNGNTPQAIVTSPIGTTFSGTLTGQPEGQGTLSVYFSDDSGVIDTKNYVTVCDIFETKGQSNIKGEAPSYVAPTTTPFIALELNLNNVWGPLLETSSNPYMDATGAVYAVQASGGSGHGSFLGALASKFHAIGKPVAFIPNALGSTSIANWQPNSGNHALTSTLYGAALTRTRLVNDHKASLLYQGEQDANLGTTQSTYETGANTVIDTWFADTGRKTVVFNINSAGGNPTNTPPIQAGLRHVGRSNAHAIPGPNMEGVWTGNIHYQSTSDINAVANAVWKVLNAQFYGGTVATGTLGALAMGTPGGDVNVDCTLGAVGIAGYSATVNNDTVVNCTVGALRISGFRIQGFGSSGAVLRRNRGVSDVGTMMNR